VVVVHAFEKKTQKTPARALEIAREREGGEVMTVSLTTLKRKWLKEPGFKEGYEALAPKFAVASLLIDARTRAKLSQVELAKKMGTSQSTVARLESGAAKPSLSTLERFAKATGMRMRVVFEPAKAAKQGRSKRAA
jgi:ribosome-binding protein aMBF1 (putative translation factor)